MPIDLKFEAGDGLAFITDITDAHRLRAAVKLKKPSESLRMEKRVRKNGST